MSPPTKELMKLTLEEKLAHGGNPILRWMMDNIYVRTDPAGNIKADKEKSTEKIDRAVAPIMALDRAIRCGNDTSASVYDDRGILFIYGELRWTNLSNILCPCPAERTRPRFCSECSKKECRLM